MRKRIFKKAVIAIAAIFLISAMSVSVYAQKQYPEKGVVSSFSFNNSIKDAKGKISFTSDEKSVVGEYVADAEGKANNAVRISSGYGGIVFKREQTDKMSVVATFRIDTLYYTSAFRLYPAEILEFDDNAQIKVEARRKDSDKKDHFHCDMGIELGKWATVVVVYDYDAQTATFYANGKQWSVTDYALKKKTYSDKQSGNIGCGNVVMDEFRIYNRALTTEEIQALCGINGNEFETVTHTIETASVKMNWKWAIIQLAFAAVCLLLLNRRRKKLYFVTPSSARIAYNNATKADRNTALQHLDNAFSYWGGTVPNDDELSGLSLKPHYYPESKKDMKASLAEFEEAMNYTSKDADEDLYEYLNLYVASYNAAHTKVYNGKWWIILTGVVAVYIHGLVPEISLGFFDNDSLIGMPDGFLPQIWYLSKYILPGVIISAIAYFAAAFGYRYQKKKGDTVLIKELQEKADSNKKMLLIAGAVVGGGLLTIIGGVVAGAVAIGLLVVGLGYIALSMFNKHGSLKEVRINRITGEKRVSESLNPTGIMLAAGIFFGVIIALYLVSGIIIALFNVVFIYKAIQNYIIKA